MCTNTLSLHFIDNFLRAHPIQDLNPTPLLNMVSMGIFRGRSMGDVTGVWECECVCVYVCVCVCECMTIYSMYINTFVYNIVYLY